MKQPAYPVFITLEDQPVLVVGGGTVAARKIPGLLAAGGRVQVVSLEIHADIKNHSRVQCLMGAYQSQMLEAPYPRWRLVFAATNDPCVNERVASDCQACGILCCNCGDAAGGDFFTPATRQAGTITVAVSTSGGSPGLAARIADAAVDAITPAQRQLAGLLLQWRDIIRQTIPDEAARRDMMRAVSGPHMMEVLESGGLQAAEDAFQQLLRDSHWDAQRRDA